MTRHGFMLLALAIVAIASWAYHVNYNTRDRLERIAALRKDIAKEREALQVLRVEWAYLNNPERLARLVKRHQKALRLVPMQPDVLSYAAAVPYPEQTSNPVPVLDMQYAEVAGVRFPVPAIRPLGWRPR